MDFFLYESENGEVERTFTVVSTSENGQTVLYFCTICHCCTPVKKKIERVVARFCQGTLRQDIEDCFRIPEVNDYYKKLLEAYVIPNKEVKTIAGKLINKWISMTKGVMQICIQIKIEKLGGRFANDS